MGYGHYRVEYTARARSRHSQLYPIPPILWSLQHHKILGSFQIYDHSSNYTIKINLVINNQLKQNCKLQNYLALQGVYASVNDIDLYIGGLAETPVPGGLVGPTFTCLLADNFAALKYNDRYFFEIGGQRNSFSSSTFLFCPG